MNKIESLIFASIISLMVLIIGLKQPEPALGAGGLNTIINKMNVSTGVLVNTTSTLLLATSTSRQYAIFSNQSSNDVYLALTNGNAAVRFEGVRLPAGGSYAISDTNLYLGAVYAIASTTAATTTVAASQ